jgi:hypothetical protein
MSNEKKPRETIAQKLARLGLKQEPGWTHGPSKFYLSRRRRRELDEVPFNKPNPNKTNDKKGDDE